MIAGLAHHHLVFWAYFRFRVASIISFDFKDSPRQ